ncbi:chromate transporter, chromate ion transporter (CHR) family [Chromobacterium violaceum]|uniref:Chromate transporter, chromate ion transporter (CHR) family n=1 Tax=Chromobacterium violaceum TaxID=536 RepID=A0A3S4I512_CHRVL|nr:chromate transporter, chromate ion transporter (CHR) family [Chromobacterium violaceum]
MVGLLLAAFYHPVWTETVRAPADFAAALLALLALAAWRLPPWLVVGLCAAAGWLTR